MASDQHEVAADIERCVGPRDADGVVKRIAIGHQRGSGENAGAVRFEDAEVHFRRESKIVGIHDEPLTQKMASLMRRNFLGLARMSLASAWNSRMAPFMASYNCGLTSNCPRVPWPEVMRSMVLSSLAARVLKWL